MNGLLSVSRSIGDSAAKDSDGPPEAQPVTCCPEIQEFKAKVGDVIVLACDGIWDVLSNDEVAQIVHENLQQNKTIQEIADILVKAAYDAGSSDNLSVVCAKFQETK